MAYSAKFRQTVRQQLIFYVIRLGGRPITTAMGSVKQIPPTMLAGVRRRLLGGAFANLFDKMAVLLVQLATIPLLSHAWGAEGYGVWLMLMTIPTYVAVSDFGLGMAAGIEVTREVTRGNLGGALAAFQSAWVAVGLIMLALASLALGYALVASLGGPGQDPELAIAIMMVTFYAVAAVQMTTLAVVYRATHKYALAMSISAAVILCEGVALFATVILGGGLVAATGALLVVRIAGLAVTYLVLVRLEPWVRLGTSHATLATVRQLARPSIAALALTLSGAISLQGMVLVLGWVGGPAIAAVFGASRFLARIPLQFSGLVMRASIPELTRAQTAGDTLLARRITQLNIITALAPTILTLPLLALFGPDLLLLMSGQTLHAEWWLFLLLSGATILSALWQALASPLIAMNRQASFAAHYVYFSILALIVSAMPAGIPLLSAALALLVMETSLVLRVQLITIKSIDADSYTITSAK